MLTSQFFSRFLILFCLSTSLVFAVAQENGPVEAATATGSQPSATTSSTYNVFSAIASSSPHNAATGSTDQPTNAQDADAQGASGTDAGGITLSTGAIIAIATVAGAAVVIAIVSAILFYLAKKREWKVRERVRRSARKVAAALTPKSATFNRSELPFSTKDNKSSQNRSKKGMVRINPPSSEPSAFPRPNRDRGTPPPRSSLPTTNRSRDSSRESNIEKGFGTRTTIEATNKNGMNTESSGTPPRSTFDMDSPVEARGKGWTKVFSRR